LIINSSRLSTNYWKRQNNRLNKWGTLFINEYTIKKYYQVYIIYTGTVFCAG
jgi:hypothetical protein